MERLINLNIKEISGVICVSSPDPSQKDDSCGIALDTAMRVFDIPQYIVIGVFSDGSCKIAGITSLSEFNDLNESFDEEILEEVFKQDTFLSLVDINWARAFVRAEIEIIKSSVIYAKEQILSQLRLAGVRLTPEAVDYLNTTF